MTYQYLSNCISQANIEINAGQFELAILWCKQALNIQPDIPEAWFNQGIAYKHLNKIELAIESFKKANICAINSSEAQNAIGLALLELGCEKDAEASLNRSITLNPSDPAPISNLGLLRKNQNRFKEAAALFINAIKIAPDVAVLYSNLAGILNRLDRFHDAVLAAEKAISLSPKLADAWNNLSISLARLNRNKDSIQAAEKALNLNPSINWLAGGMTYSKLKICDWEKFQDEKISANKNVNNGNAYIEPIAMLSMSDDSHLQKMCAEIYTQSLYKPSKKPSPLYKNNKIKIGYISSDFGSHAVSFLCTGLIESHDRTSFEIHGFDTGTHETGEYRNRISSSFDHFHTLTDKSTSEMIKCILNNKIDILIDLNGHTKGSKTDLFAERLASVQVNFIGYPGTMGARFIDYIIGDKTLIPIDESKFYTEKIIYLPNCFQPNDSKRKIGIASQREAYGLKNENFVFGCFNQPAKITPEVFSAWMRILESVPNSVLWLAVDEEDAKSNLLAHASAKGIAANRICFAERVSYEEHLARHKFVDLMLDTFPFNGGTTTSDSLWSGTPILTIAGRSFASRMGASLLNCMGLNSLITTSVDNYVSRAIELAIFSEKLIKIRNNLAKEVKSGTLFNTRLYTRHFETGLKIALSRCHSGLLPNHIFVSE